MQCVPDLESVDQNPYLAFRWNFFKVAEFVSYQLLIKNKIQHLFFLNFGLAALPSVGGLLTSGQ